VRDPIRATEDREMRRFAASALRSYGLGVLFDLKRGPTSTGRDHIRVVHLKARSLQPLDVVDLRAEDKLHADLVDDDGDAVDLEDVVVLLGLVEGERVLKAGASATADGYAQSLLGPLDLTPEQLADLLGGLIGEGDRGIWRIGHFTKCSWTTRRTGQVCQNRPC
jgi:hypothetical protein